MEFFSIKVETIGDAYCVAGGLHKDTKTHAQQIAWMAMRMIETCSFHQTHDGQPIRVSTSILIFVQLLYNMLVFNEYYG